MKKINKILLTVATMVASNSALAFCPAAPPTAEYLFMGTCSQDKQISSFSGTAQSDLNTIKDDIKDSGDDLVDIVEKSSISQVNIINESATAIIEALMQLSLAETQDEATRSKLLHEAKLNYMNELKTAEIKAKNSSLGVDDTKEEVALLLKILEESATDDIPALIVGVKTNMDEQNFQIPVKLQSAAETCDKEDPYACAVMKTVTPGAKLEILFEECSREKQVVTAQVQKQIVSQSISRSVTESQQAAVKVQNVRQASTERLQRQRKISCSPEEYNSAVCLFEMSKEEYGSAIRSNQVVVNGNVSAVNFYTPASVGNVSGSTTASAEDLALVARSNIIFEGNESDKAPPLDNTFKSSAQYFAAIDMSDNLLNETAVANQALSDRKNLNNATFQANYLSRMAALSLSKYSLHTAINKRTGTNVNSLLASGEATRDNNVKEKYNGAGEMDQLIFSVEEDYNKMMNADGVGTNTKTVLLDIWETQNKKNKLILEQIIRNERIELLLAVMLANEYNSPEYTAYLSSVRGR